MTLTKFPNGVSSYGLPVVGGAHITTGTIFFVDSNTGSNSYDGKDSVHPVSTITYALGLCTANKGDIIYVMPGHVESADVNVNKAGVTIIGLGQGALRPRAKLVTDTSASWLISSCDVLIENIVFQTSIPLLARALEVNADDFTLLNCEWDGINDSDVPVSVVIVSSSANSVTIDGLRATVTSSTGPCTVIYLHGGFKHTIKNSFLVSGKATTTIGSAGGPIGSCDGSPLQELLIANNVMCTISSCSSGSAAVCGLTTGTGSGLIVGNYLGQNMTSQDGFWGSTWADISHDYGFYDNLFCLGVGTRGNSSVAGITPSCSG
jgi:hypothetical protein